MEYREFTGKNVEEALTSACEAFSAHSEELEYEVIDKGSTGVFGLGSRPAVIKAAKKETSLEAVAKEFLTGVFKTMDMEVEIESEYDEVEKEMSLNLIGDDMGILIGKRGQTLDSIQYLTSLVVNKGEEEYIRVKVDIENYRERREETLVNLTKNLAHKVKRTHREVELEPMNPYERRVIHSTLQGDKYVVTRSEGEEPYRHVVIALKRDKNDRGDRNRRSRYRDDRRY
ncbi:MAG: protein jag [Lachnospiraceae bacterium]|nr:protein jag [Lachnospiraceae bacterium]